jgi:hypothetical protein
LPSASWRELQCSSQRSVGTSANPDQYNSSGSQSTVLTACYLGVTLDMWLTWSHQIDQTWKKATQRLGLLGPILHRRSGLSIRNGVLLYNQCAPSGEQLLAAMLGHCRCFNLSGFTLLCLYLGTMGTVKFTRMLEFHSSSTTSEA